MNFFEHQEQARKATGRLVFFFGLAVLCIFGALYWLFSLILLNSEGGLVWDFDLAWKTALGTTLIVGLGCLYKTTALAGGGKVVAESLGGQLLSRNTSDLLMRRLLNVVDEMAIASGVPSPPVYLMEEPSINAFAAGYSPENAVIGVTRGCVEKLDRDQLQGVMAHEFSHILNGDMRMNIRLIGVLHGILLIAGIGYFLMRIGSYSSRGRSREGGGIGIALLVGGLGLLVIGYVGSFFGGLIKAAVSRQREYLADASAVQFTRYPEGIAGALKRIGGFSEGSKLGSPNATECSHMFFGAGISSLFATHPPLEKRILRIDRHWKGGYPSTDGIIEQADASEFAAVSSLAAGTARGESVVAFSPEASIEAAGHPTNVHLAHARQVISEIPPSLIDRVQEPFGARAVVYALFMDSDNDEVRSRQLDFLGKETERGTAEETEKATALLSDLTAEQKFSLVELASPALAHLSPGQSATFRGIIDHLAAADEGLDLFEWSLRKVIDHDLGQRFAPRHRRHGRATVRKLASECHLILGALAHYGQGENNPAPSFEAGLSAFTHAKSISLPAPGDCGVAQLDQATSRLERLSPLAKQALLQACARTISHDHVTTEVEAQILRGVAAGLSCPLPPIPGSAATFKAEG